MLPHLGATELINGSDAPVLEACEGLGFALKQPHLALVDRITTTDDLERYAAWGVAVPPHTTPIPPSPRVRMMRCAPTWGAVDGTADRGFRLRQRGSPRRRRSWSNREPGMIFNHEGPLTRILNAGVRMQHGYTPVARKSVRLSSLMSRPTLGYALDDDLRPVIAVLPCVRLDLMGNGTGHVGVLDGLLKPLPSATRSDTLGAW